MSDRTFATQTEEIQYWKTKVAALEKEAKDAKEEFLEFQEGSRELEHELETQLEQSEAKIKEFRSLTNRLQQENDQLKDKVEQCHKEYHFQVTELQTELSEIKAIKEQLNKYIRELEQQNDDLERAKRSTLASLEDFEARMNTAIERNAFLESELDEKESLKAAVQRMKDETRDLKSELKIMATTENSSRGVVGSSNGVITGSSGGCSGVGAANGDGMPDNDKSLLMNNNNKKMYTADSNKHAADHESKDILDTPPSSSKSSPSRAPLTPSARLSALNIVGDLLRKVGALELKLSSCRNIVKETSPASPTANGTVTTAPGASVATPRRLSRSVTPVAES